MLVDMRCSFTATYPAHIVGSAILGAFPDPLALSVNMISTMPTGSEVSDTPTGLFTACSGRQDPGQIDNPKLNFGRAESLRGRVKPKSYISAQRDMMDLKGVFFGI